MVEGKNLEPLLVSIKDVCKILGCGQVTLWRKREDPTFPKPIKLTDRKVMYSFEQIKNWVNKQTQSNEEILYLNSVNNEGV